MGRPPLDVGTYGAIRVYPLTAGGFKATTQFRDFDGKTRPVKRHGATKAAASRALKAALLERQRRNSADLDRDSTFAEVGELWLAEVERTRVGSSYDRYRTKLRNKIIPVLGSLRLHEVTSGTVNRYLRALEDGGLAPNTVRTYRTVVSGVLAYAVRMDAIAMNAATGAAPVRGGNSRATKRALTAAEREDLFLKLDSSRYAARYDLADIMRYMVGTGVRLGEVLSLRWFRVDLDEGVSVHGDNLVRETGKGLVLHEPKTLAGFRVLPLPDFVVMLLRLRYPGEQYAMSPVFANEAGNWRDPNNFVHYVKKAAIGAEYPWFTSHVCRRTAATIMDEQGLSAREISGYLGHANPSFSQDQYMDQAPQSGRAGAALDAAMRPGNSVRPGRKTGP